MADPIIYTRETAQEWEAKLIQAIKQLEEVPDDQAERAQAEQVFEAEKIELQQIKDNIQALELRLKEVVANEIPVKKVDAPENAIEKDVIQEAPKDATEKDALQDPPENDALKDEIHQAQRELEGLENHLNRIPKEDRELVDTTTPEQRQSNYVRIGRRIEHNEKAKQRAEEQLEVLNKIVVTQNETEEETNKKRVEFAVEYKAKQIAVVIKEIEDCEIKSTELETEKKKNKRVELAAELKEKINVQKQLIASARRKMLENIEAQKATQKLAAEAAAKNAVPDAPGKDAIQEAKAELELQLKLEKDKLIQAEEEFKNNQADWDAFNKKWEENKQTREKAQREREQLEAEKNLVLLRNKPEEILAIVTNRIKTQILNFELEHPANLHKEIRKALLQIRSSLVKMQLADAGLKDDVEIENNEAVLFAGKNIARQHFYATIGMLYEVCERFYNYNDPDDDKAQRKLLAQFNARVEALIDACFYDERDDSLKQYRTLDVIPVDDAQLIRIENKVYTDVFDTLETIEESIPAEKSPVLHKLQNLSETLRLEIDSAPDLDRKHRVILLEQTVEMIEKAKANKLTEADIAQYQALAQQSQQDRPSVGWKIAGLILAIAGLLVAAAAIFAKYKSLMLLTPIADPLIGGGTAGILMGLAMYQYGNQSCVASAMNNVVTGLKEAQLAQPPVEPEQEKVQEELLLPQEDENGNHFEAPKKNVEDVEQDDKRKLLV